MSVVVVNKGKVKFCTCQYRSSAEGQSIVQLRHFMVKVHQIKFFCDVV